MHRRGWTLAWLPLLLAGVACAPTDDSSSGSSGPSASASASASTDAADCTPEKLDLLQAGRLNIGTDSPA